MPHDRNGRMLATGDEVTIHFRVQDITSESERGCNVQLVSINPFGGSDTYASHLACNSRIAEKVAADEAFKHER